MCISSGVFQGQNCPLSLLAYYSTTAVHSHRTMDAGADPHVLTVYSRHRLLALVRGYSKASTRAVATFLGHIGPMSRSSYPEDAAMRKDLRLIPQQVGCCWDIHFWLTPLHEWDGQKPGHCSASGVVHDSPIIKILGDYYCTYEVIDADRHLRPPIMLCLSSRYY